MKPPRLNRKLTLEHPERVSDGAGGYTVEWQVLGTLWVQLKGYSGREGGSVSAPVSSVNYKIIVRSTPLGSPDRPAPEQRFRDGDRVFHINAVVEDDLNGRYLTCFAREETVV